MKEKFINKNFAAASLSRLRQVNEVLTEFRGKGYNLSLRQLYYQLVARALIENSQRSYKRLGNLVNDARLAGLIDWNMIVDRGRSTNANSHWTDPGDIIKSAVESFAMDKWDEQDNHIEVMVEKDALSGVLWPVCEELDIRFTANKGYPSASLMYRFSNRLANKVMEDKTVYILHLGDHDPSGIDMTRDIIERVEMFTREHIHVERLALNMDQVERYQPPENPAKVTDSRSNVYIAEFGRSSWELDALEPQVLGNLVRDFVMDHRDHDAWNAAVEAEDEYRDELQEFADKYK